MEQLDCVEVVANDDVENIWRRCTAFRSQQAARPLRCATEAARRGETEFREMPPRRLQLTALAVGNPNAMRRSVSAMNERDIDDRSDLNSGKECSEVDLFDLGNTFRGL